MYLNAGHVHFASLLPAACGCEAVSASISSWNRSEYCAWHSPTTVCDGMTDLGHESSCILRNVGRTGISYRFAL